MGDSTFNIVNFDGGGLRGLLSISLFERIQREFPDTLKRTDMIGGTSTGSLIALGLAYGLSPREVRNMYSDENVKYIFDKSYSEMLRPKYDNKHLRDVLRKVFPEKLKLKDLKKLVVIPSLYIGNETSEWKPIFYNNLPDSPTENARVIDVAMCSSAAPVFFPTYDCHIDGGIVASDPSLATIVYALDQKLGKKPENIRLLSIGTGYLYNSIKHDTTGWGAIDWVISKEPYFPIISVTLEGNSQTSQLFSSMLLDENYHRLNPRMNKDIGMDDVESLDYLKNLGKDYNIDETIKWMSTKWNRLG
ncbi:MULTISPECIES: patatin-like phospholipase family protein [unclassified Romboutsia]|uniref:patatin-like phospholipase family protein n=1 Tax=unclassified Romboutsia TaxID=2626894 RepID=UPI0008219BAB|nr:MULTISPECIES: patatin-like phospholipase family protein [unclassified Romboutsia]SCH18713.1 Patatin [uncultured Clostridium sp.]